VIRNLFLEIHCYHSVSRVRGDLVTLERRKSEERDGGKEKGESESGSV